MESLYKQFLQDRWLPFSAQKIDNHNERKFVGFLTTLPWDWKHLMFGGVHRSAPPLEWLSFGGKPSAGLDWGLRKPNTRNVCRGSIIKFHLETTRIFVDNGREAGLELRASYPLGVIHIRFNFLMCRRLQLHNWTPSARVPVR